MLKPRTLLCTLLCAIGCNSEKPDPRLEKLATGFCECTSQLVIINKNAATLATDTTGNSALVFKQLEIEYNNTKDCMASVIAQYGRLKKAELVIMEKILNKKCATIPMQKELLRDLLGD
jgi:hypothetical protein